jgi:hypothetical protein
MKILSKYWYIIVVLILMIFLYRYFFVYNFTDTIELKDLSKKYYSEYDTQIESPMYLYVFIEGESDGDCEIWIHPYNQKRKRINISNQLDIRRFPIKKGRVSISYKEDWYSTPLVVEYFSETAQRGNLKIKIGVN